MSEFLDLPGAFTIGVLVAAFLFISYIFFEHKLGAWSSEELVDDSSSVFWKNVGRAFNPVANACEVVWRPAVSGLGGNRFGTGKLPSAFSDFGHGGEDDGAEGAGERVKALDGLRALAFLWVLAFTLNELLASMRDEYADSRWYAATDERVFLWKLAAQGYMGLSLFMVLSAYLFATANLNMQASDAMSVDADAPFSAKVWSRYVPLLWTKVCRLWPAMATAVFFVGFLWPEYINPSNAVLQQHLSTCEDYWWSNVFFVANFVKVETNCFEDAWAVSLLLQLCFLVPLPCYLFAQGGTKRWWAYALVYSLVALSLGARGLTVWRFGLQLDPTGEGLADNAFWLQRMPWCRAGEYLMGVLVAFSVADAREDEPPKVVDVFRIAGEPFRDWLADPRLLAATTLQTATLAVGWMFLYEGTLQREALNFSVDAAGAAAVLVSGDLIAAAALAILVRWAVSALHGSWLRRFLALPLWYPVASLSYTAWLFMLAGCYWAVEVLAKDYGHPVDTGYGYFAMAYFLSLVFCLGLGLLVSVAVERPLLKLGQLQQ